MLTILYYFFQVLLCSSIMMGYYWLVLRNKKFHQYNRFYLLAITIFSWMVPLIKIRWQQPIEDDVSMYYLLSVVATNNTEIESSLHSNWYNINWQSLLATVYIAISVVFLVGMVGAMYKIYRLLKLHSCKTVGDVFLILTRAKGTPFSFFNYIFWNEAIDIKTNAGKQILQHELTHVREKHSVDKILMQVVLIGGWFNPIFWLIRKELEMIHEFIADKKCIDNGNTAALAEMLLTAAYPQQKFLLTNPFFFSPIKRRIAMLKNNNNPRFSYLRRLVVLPLLAIVIVLFAFRNADANSKPISVGTVIENIYDNVAGKLATAIPLINADLNKTYTIVINAGHGGSDKGALGADGKTYESELTLLLAKQIKALNSNSKLNIVLTRGEDVFQTVAEQASIANNANPDLFIALHYNNALPIKSSNKIKENPTTGMEIYIPNPAKTNQYTTNLAFANKVANTLDNLDVKFNGIKSRKEGIYVLQHVNSPSILIEAGYISNSSELEKVKDPSFQEKLAISILNGVQKYLLAKEQGKDKMDTVILNSDSVYLIPKGKSVKIAQENGIDSTQTLILDGKTGTNIFLSPNFGRINGLGDPLILLNNEIIDKNQLSLINNNDVYSIDVLKGAKSVELFGDKGKHGVINITTKKNDQITPTTTVIKKGNLSVEMPVYKELIIVDGKIMTNEAFWNSGVRAENIKIMEILKKPSEIEKYGEAGKNGVILITTKLPNEASEIKGQFQQESILSVKPKVNIIENLNSNGQSKNISLKPDTIPQEHYDKVFTVTQVPAEFPGGKEGWLKFLEKNLNRDLPVENGAPPGKYTVKLSLIVDKEGNVNNVKAENNPGYGTAAEAVRVIATGPKWIPAKLNGKNVVYRLLTTVTYLISDE